MRKIVEKFKSLNKKEKAMLIVVVLLVFIILFSGKSFMQRIKEGFKPYIEKTQDK